MKLVTAQWTTVIDFFEEVTVQWTTVIDFFLRKLQLSELL